MQREYPSIAGQVWADPYDEVFTLEEQLVWLAYILHQPLDLIESWTRTKRLEMFELALWRYCEERAMMAPADDARSLDERVEEMLDWDNIRSWRRG